jgi:glutamyl-tRNA synthetase
MEQEMTLPDGKKRFLSPYRELSPEEQAEKLAQAGGKLPIRFKCPLGIKVEWHDLVRGPVSFLSDEIGDFIICKSNGSPLYNLAVVCDDAEMKITHVLRGEDHISNTPKQLLLYAAHGYAPPQFGHVPLIVGMDRARLSKRHGATSVSSYREMGILPEALANFLVLIGWAPSGESEAANQEMFSREEMVRYFNPQEIGKSAGAFNIEKLNHFNGLYIRSLPPAEFSKQLQPFVPADWLAYRGEEYASQALALYQDKLVTLTEIEQHAWYFFRDPVEEDYNEKSLAKFLTGNEQAPAVLSSLYASFAALSEGEWDEEHLAPLVEGFCESSGLGKGKVMQPWRVALTGDKISPGFFDLIVTLGREAVLRRAKPWLARLGA